ncbi:MAG: amidohydrolase family protein [Phycisphaerae bacterium]|nr:amidohydrolase family protein [Planctomycetia bacterium]MCK6465744.1 amidohydrolase family protein [Phycisphaerae bacterium]MCL4719078.1 amidohydrolase family protein [Phycisphaerae bacterium]NUQ08967.1 amidohydrolase family protein [Phycisphaerae bacterium]
MIFRAKWVYPVEGSAIENGAVVAEGGKIVEVGPFAALRGATGEPVDLGDVVLLPGFVNAHTHLDLSDLHGQVPPQGLFIPWLSALMQKRSAATPDETSTAEAVRRGIEESLACGVTAIGDVTTTPDWTRPMLARSHLRSVSFGEVIAIGQRRSMLERRLAAALAAEWAAPRLRVGVSPHAPYTIEPAALRRCAEAAREIGAPVCMHLLETAQEERFAVAGDGDFREFLMRMKVWDDRVDTPGVDPVTWLEREGLLSSKTLLAHVNYVTDAQLAVLAERGPSVAYCPRTHAAFGHPPHRFREMLARGINVCIGTDSLASNPSLSVLEELRHVRRACPDISAETLVRLGTLAGAKALGLDDQIGALMPRRWADLVAVPAPSGKKLLLDRVLDGTSVPTAAYIAGKRVYPSEPVVAG